MSLIVGMDLYMHMAVISVVSVLEFGLHWGYYYLAICEVQISYRKARVVCRDDMKNFSLILLI
jgi:hypothetical protein